MTLSPLNQRRLENFRANRRGFFSFVLFITLFTLSLFAEFIANDKPIVVFYEGSFYMPIFRAHPETTFDGEFETEADYRDPFVADKINEAGWMIWPLVPYSHRTVAWDLPVPAPDPAHSSRCNECGPSGRWPRR